MAYATLAIFIAPFGPIVSAVLFFLLWKPWRETVT